MCLAAVWQSRWVLLQTDRGIEQAHAAGDKIRGLMESDGVPYRLYFYM